MKLFHCNVGKLLYWFIAIAYSNAVKVEEKSCVFWQQYFCSVLHSLFHSCIGLSKLLQNLLTDTNKYLERHTLALSLKLISSGLNVSQTLNKHGLDSIFMLTQIFNKILGGYRPMLHTVQGYSGSPISKISFSAVPGLVWLKKQ